MLESQKTHFVVTQPCSGIEITFDIFLYSGGFIVLYSEINQLSPHKDIIFCENYFLFKDYTLVFYVRKCFINEYLHLP